jgi:hypothetical protein
MSYSFIQTPATMSLAQSPVIFSVSSSTLVGQSNFQYIGELTIWTGSVADSGSGNTWTLAKYPSSQGLTGIFDLSRIINSTQTELIQQNISPIKYFRFDSYYRYQSGSVYFTGSVISSSVFQAADGYQIFPEAIGAQINTLTPLWPIMSSGPATQSVFLDNIGSSSIFVGDVNNLPQPTRMVYLSSTGTQEVFSLPASTGNSNTLVTGFPTAPAQSGFPLSTVGLDWFTIRAFSHSQQIGQPVLYNIACQQKYPNIRIKWKNRFGQFDYLNFDMVNKQSITTSRRNYQPQLGSFSQRTLSYNTYDSQTLAYIIDTKQNIIVNSNWLTEDYNDILKQLLVSDEIYWMQYNTTDVTPLTIITSNIQFKTGVVDKLIQYQFEFQLGQNYKLII